jgi:hypothetical protein
VIRLLDEMNLIIDVADQIYVISMLNGFNESKLVSFFGVVFNFFKYYGFSLCF